MDRRRAQARRVFHGRARPLSRRSRRSRRRAAPDRCRYHGGPTAACTPSVQARAQRADARGRTRVGPELLFAGRRALVRGWINGVALHIAKPQGDRRLFPFRQEARCASCIAPASATTISPRNRIGCAAPMAAPISPISSSPPAFETRGLLYRIAAYEDLRHLLKHKRRYAPDALTPKERRILARKRWPPASGWRPARRSITPSPAGCSISPIAKAAARGWSMTLRY